MKTLAIDWGRKRIGLALGEPGFVPEILPVLEGLTLNAAVAATVSICRENKVETIVIGLPLQSDGSETINTKVVKELGARLVGLGKIKVVYLDEAMTSHEAKNRLQSCGYGKKSLKKNIDSEAAALLLDEYLNSC